MRNLKSWQLLVVALLSCATMAYGDQVKTRLQPIPSDQTNPGAVYPGAYPFSMDGSTSVATAVCGDFNHEIYVGASPCFTFSTLTPRPMWRVPVAGISGPFNLCPSRSERFVRTYHACQLASINTLTIGMMSVSGASTRNRSLVEFNEDHAR